MRFTSLGSAVAIIAALTLTGCTASAPQSASCAPKLTEGPITASTQVSGAFGEVPTITTSGKPSANASEREVVLSGDENGRPAQANDVVSVNFVVIDADNGKELQVTEFDADKGAAPVLLTQDFTFTGLYEGLLCAQPGDRILLAIAPKDGLGSEALASFGVSEKSTLLMAVDVVDVRAPRSEGAVRQLPNGFPNVVTDAEGRVGIVLPPSNPGTVLEKAVRIEGDGSVIDKSDVVFGQVLTVDWTSRQILASTWADGSPTSFGSELDGDALRTQLTGYKVGSQIVLITPGQSGPQVSVVDIIGIG